MKWLKRLLILILVLSVLGIVSLGVVNVDMIESDLPTNVYEEDSNLGTLINIKLFDLFMTTVTNEYTIVEEVVNLIILDSIRENVNDQYNPLSDCETVECNFITYGDILYVSHIWAELNSDNQLVVHVSYGTERLIGFNTIMDFIFDISIDDVLFGIELTLESYNINNLTLSMSILDNIFARIDTNEIENSVSSGVLDLEEYTYKISFDPFS